MDVTNIGSPAVSIPKNTGSGDGTVGQSDGVAKTQTKSVQQQATAQLAEVDKVSRKDLDAAAGALNNFMDSLDVQIKFVIHSKSKEMMVQVMDEKEQKVLREFPAHQLLDTMAAIREYVGALLDKKA